MSITMHSASVPVFARMLGNIGGWLDKAEAHAAAKKFDTSVFLASRLAPDMLPFTRQIQFVCDAAKFGVARLAGVEAPKFEDNEATLDDLRERVRKTLAYVASVSAASIDGSEEREIVIPMRTRDAIRLSGLVYLQHWALPNFYFHITTAYALLRQGGVELGKADFLAMA